MHTFLWLRHALDEASSPTFFLDFSSSCLAFFPRRFGQALM